MKNTTKTYPPLKGLWYIGERQGKDLYLYTVNNGEYSLGSHEVSVSIPEYESGMFQGKSIEELNDWLRTHCQHDYEDVWLTDDLMGLRCKKCNHETVDPDE